VFFVRGLVVFVVVVLVVLVVVVVVVLMVVVGRCGDGIGGGFVLARGGGWCAGFI
jgi:hypothetical protein